MTKKSEKPYRLRRVIECHQTAVGFKVRHQLTLNCGHIVIVHRHKKGAMAKCYECAEQERRDLL